MIVSELKPMEEIIGYLEGENKVFMVGCNGCAEACQTGGEAQVIEMKKRLEELGKKVTGHCVVDFLCNKVLVKVRLLPYQNSILEADSLLIMTCGIGTQAVANAINKPVHPACNTVNLGGSRGEWPGSERCLECGDCVLDFTGGICPLTACTKQLINGQCGGAKEGRCEVEPDVRPCGWVLFFERLKAIGRLDVMKKTVPPKDYSKASPPKAIRSTIMWDVEQEEAKV
jgi:ferredoxin